jgi:hypothetical protein
LSYGRVNDSGTDPSRGPLQAARKRRGPEIPLHGP